ncbi:hypothetical protein EYZ11_010294 [Aspergillus tanneri]|uniref:Uncharacterized protein n=1 Tax=Aspergillus tanneri TaxID=1220188 RepID=A0A4S3J7V0_9EURO|nr:hypothetical protein EYZ11_010294 [Aspergillus tanneri]
MANSSQSRAFPQPWMAPLKLQALDTQGPCRGRAILAEYFGLFARRRPNDNIYKQIRRFLNQVFPAEHMIPRSLVHYYRDSTGVLLPQDASPAARPSLGKRKQEVSSQSDLPKHVSVDTLPDPVCYRDIELFYLKDPDGKRDVLCAIIEFRNLNSRPEGANGYGPPSIPNYSGASCSSQNQVLYTR